MTDFLQLIYNWYNSNKRNLPWRKTEDPYKIWISEIILQQTRVDQGLEYYQKFIKAFPDIESLASANENQVLKLWQGLGYYSRARNLHESAKVIKAIYNGIFPRSHTAILSLKGIGPYTAAAIASIAFGLPHPVLDGNVYRFLARYFGIESPADSATGKKEFYKTACEIMSHNNPGYHNQALMEFGALQCTPMAPDCFNCPLASSCYAFNRKKVLQLPVKSKKTGKRSRYFCYYLIEFNNYIWLEKRTANDIWKNLYQFPVIETSTEISDEYAATYPPPFLNGAYYHLNSVSAIQKHVLTHQILFARLVHIKLTGQHPVTKNYLKIHKTDLPNYAVPRLIEKLTEKSKILKF